MGEIARFIPQSKNRQIEIELIAALIATVLVAFFFYRSFWGLLLLPLVFMVCKRFLDREFGARRRERCLLEFKEMLQSISSSLKAGYSIENAISDTERDIYQVYGEDSILIDGIRQMKKKLSLQISVESAMEDFAKEYGYEEMLSFSFMMSFAKRLGGNYIKNIQNATWKLGQRIEVKQEIESYIAEKKLELRVMALMPIGIILYITVTSYEFISGLYHNPLGILVMTACLVAYVLFVYLGLRIIRIVY